jgi:HAE1 family hydrophobic/amphiphilic exporter-1
VFLARDQSRITQIRIDVGASAPLDILQPRVQIATSEQQLITATSNVRSAEDRLRQLMNLPASEWDRPIIPTDKVTYTPMNIDLEASVARAYTLRPEIREQALTTATRRVQYLFARNQVLPQFDANLGYNVTGAAGFARDSAGNTIINTGYSQSLQQVLQNKNPGWNVGVTIGVPIFNIGARAEARRAELDLKQSQVIDTQIRQNIAVDVRSTARLIDTAAKEIAASRTAREAAEQNLQAERKRYENGMTTNFQVLQVQQQLSDARASELQALVGYAKAVAAYHRAVGDLLDVHNISVDVPPVEAEHPIFTRLDRYNWLNYGNSIKGDEQQK